MQQCLQQCNSGIGGNRGSLWPVTRGNRGRSRFGTRNYGPGDSDSRQLTENATEQRKSTAGARPGQGEHHCWNSGLKMTGWEDDWMGPGDDWP